MLYDTVAICCGVRSGDLQSHEELYRFIRQICWPMLCKRVRFSDEKTPDDLLHDTYLEVVGRIRAGKVRQFERLAGYVRPIAQSAVAQVHRDREREAKALRLAPFSVFESASQEHRIYARERKRVLHSSLKRLDPNQRELITRLYLNGQKKPQICREMNISQDRYPYLKAQSKEKLFWFAERKLAA